MQRVLSAYETAKRWDFSVVEAYMARKGYDLEHVSGMKEEYIRFMAVVVGTPTRGTVSKAVDDFWHAHVLHTRDYAAFGQKFDGFIHHNPVASEEERLSLAGSYDEFRDEYEKHFGKPDPKWWGDGDMMCRGYCDSVFVHH